MPENTPTSGDGQAKDDLYVGYLPLPKTFRNALIVAVSVTVAATLAAAAVVAASHKPAGNAVWEDQTSALSGRLMVNPYPILIAIDPATGTSRPVLVVNSGKHGAESRLSELNGRTVTLQGTLLRRANQVMLELDDATDAVVETKPDSVLGPQESRKLGNLTLTGEILDSKCYLGAMKPGQGKAHKGCATLCIRGGIPPLFMAADNSGQLQYYLIVDQDGHTMDAELQSLIGEPVIAQGEAEVVDGMNRIRLSRTSVRRP